MKNLDWIKFCKESIRASAAKIMEIYISEKRSVVVSRGKGGDKTLLADKSSEDIVIEKLRNSRVDVKLISEEQGEVIIGKMPQFTVLLDPLDGSFNFKTGIDYFAISMAVMDQQSNLIAGYVMDVTQGVEYYATEAGAYKNDTRIETSRRSNMDRVLLECNRIVNSDELGIIYRNLLKMRHVRAPGAVALDLCRVADGTFDCLFCCGASRFLDVAAGIYILEKAGGIVSDFKGNNHIREGTELKAGNLMAAGNRSLHELLLASTS